MLSQCAVGFAVVLTVGFAVVVTVGFAVPTVIPTANQQSISSGTGKSAVYGQRENSAVYGQRDKKPAA